jgi:hypothetical protein
MYKEVPFGKEVTTKYSVELVQLQSAVFDHEAGL